MKKILILSVVMLSFAFAISALASSTVGNDATVRANTDTRADFVLVDTNNPADHTGNLDRFYYYATTNLPFYFIVVDDSFIVQWVSEVVNPVTVPGMNYFKPAIKAYIEAGWNVGLYYPQTGVVPFNYSGDDRAYFTNAGWGMPAVGQTLVFQDLVQNRTYSYVAYYDDDCTTETMVSDISTLNAGYTIVNPVSNQTNPSSYTTSWVNSVLYYNSAYLNPVLNPNLNGASWISTSLTGSEGSYTDWQWRLFKQDFNLPVNATDITGTVYFAADNDTFAYLGGSKIGQTGSVDIFNTTVPAGNPAFFTSAWSASFTPVIGANTLSFVLRNWAWTGVNPTAIIYRANIDYCVPVEVDMDGDGYNSDKDCDDTNATIHPSAVDSNCNGIDENCDGIPDDGYVSTPTSCGVGACASTGEWRCADGQTQNTCVEGKQQDELCNAADDDCDGDTDEGNVCVWECSLQNEEITSPLTGWTGLGTNRWIYMPWGSNSTSPDNNGWYTVKPKKGTGTGPTWFPTLDDTHNCSCSQILTWLHTNLPELYGEMNGHWKYGCSQSAIQDFMRLAAYPYTAGDVGFDSTWGHVDLDFNAYETTPATGEVNWARVTGSINSWSGPVILTNVVDFTTALFTVYVTASTVPAVQGCDITFKVIDGSPDSVQITAVVDHTLGSCGAVGQVQGPWNVTSGNLTVVD